MATSQTYDDILSDLLKADPDIKGIAVVLRNGLVVASKLRDENTDEDLLAATTSVFDIFIKRVEKDFGSAESFINVMTVDENKFLFAGAGSDAILSIVAKLGADDKRLKVYGRFVAQQVQGMIDREPFQLQIPKAIHLMANARASSFPQGEFMKKVIILGDNKVGKSCVIRQLIEGAFDEYYLPTIGIQIHEKKAELSDSCTLIFKIWEMESQSQAFSPLRNRFYADTAMGIIIFDLTRHSSFENIQRWTKTLREMFNEAVPFIILGNKSDLTSQEVSPEEIAQLEAELDTIVFTVSAKTRQNIDEAFSFAAHRIFGVI